jgi:hypothetical protein
MPWIEPQYLECAVYLYPSRRHAEEGTKIGGSGFVVGIDVGEPGVEYTVRPQVLCVVTNKHLLDEVDKLGGVPTVRLNTIQAERAVSNLNANFGSLINMAMTLRYAPCLSISCTQRLSTSFLPKISSRKS